MSSAVSDAAEAKPAVAAAGEAKPKVKRGGVAKIVTGDMFVPEQHFYPRVLNAAVHPIVGSA